MADQEHLDILKQGVDAWNKWREKHPLIKPDLIGASLSYANLRSANLSDAILMDANLSDADLSEANLSEAILISANLRYADLSYADLKSSHFWRTVLGDADLSNAKHFESCVHHGPSTIDHRTLQRSGRIPKAFLKGCGLPDTLIEYYDSLLLDPIQWYSCFISYSSVDDEFAQRLHTELDAKGVRNWFAPEDMKIGDKIRVRIDEAIRIHDKLLIVLSENALNSAWVENEVETALEQEQKRKQLVLFPVRVDDAAMETDKAWAATIRRTRHIGDFTNWKDHDAFTAAFERLLRDLKQES